MEIDIMLLVDIFEAFAFNEFRKEKRFGKKLETVTK